MKKLFSAALFSFLCFSGVFAVDDFVPEDEENNITGTSSSGFVIDSADGGGDLQLQFGDTLGEYLQWDNTNANFVLSDSLILGGNLDITETEFTFDSDNTGLGNDVRIIANQGSDNAGEIRYNATDNQWEFSNDGGSFEALGSGGGGGLAPYIESILASKVEPTESISFTITGSNFDYNTQVSIPGWEGTIDDVRYISSSEIEVDITAGATETVYSVVVENAGLDSTGYVADNGLNTIDVLTLPDWLDLRSTGISLSTGNGAGNDVRHHASMAVVRDTNGMYFTGLGPWSSWAKFEILQWNRGDNKTLEWIFSGLDGNMMIGIGSTATNETNTAQYQQAEVEAYFSNATSFWGLYGNNGTVGTAGNQGDAQAISSGVPLKIKFEGDGGVGSTFTLYQLPSTDPSNWNDESIVLKTMTIGGTLNPDEANIMPFIIPRNGGGQRFVAVRTY